MNAAKTCAGILLMCGEVSARDAKTAVQPPAGPPAPLGSCSFLWKLVERVPAVSPWCPRPHAVRGLWGGCASGLCSVWCCTGVGKGSLVHFLSSLVLVFSLRCLSLSDTLPSLPTPFSFDLMDPGGTGLVKGEEGCSITWRHKCSSTAQILQRALKR